MKQVKISQRIRILKEKRKTNIKPQEIPLRDKIYREMAAVHAGECIEKQFAYGFEKFLEEKSILIQEQDLLAGFAFHYAYNSTFPANGPEDFDPTVKSVFKMDVDREIEDAKEVFGLSEESELLSELCTFKEGVDSWLYKHWHTGHFAAGYGQLLRKGFGGILRDEEEALKNRPECRDTLEAFQIVTRACIAYILRYQALAKQLAEKSADADQRKRMKRMEESCGRIANGVPETFFDAVQLTWFAHELALCESYPSSVSIGRFDYFLYPFYQKDMENNRLSREEALELVEAFWIKCSTNTKGYQNLAVGGTDENGRCSVNDLTYLCMEATENLRFDQPSLTFRWTKDMPEEIWPAILRLIKTGMGFPAIFNDECCRKAKKRIGIKEEDIYQYAFIGCVELTIPGKEYSLTEIARLNLPKVLELMLHQGKDPESGKILPLKHRKTMEEIDGIQTFEEFYGWYLSEMEYFIRLGIDCVNAFDTVYVKKYPLPFLSTLMEGCIEKGTDVSAGGADYNNSAFNMGGIATIIDSLAAIKKLVYDEKKVKMSEYIQAMDVNYEGYEELRMLASKGCPKYGNDVDEVDLLGVNLVETFSKIVEEYESPRGGTYRVGLYTVEDHAIMGSVTGATADGRLRGMAFSNSLSSVQGKDVSGPTALMNTINKFDLSRATNGMVLDIKFTPAFLETENHTEAVKNLIETYFSKGGMELQISVVSRETLLEAQKNPEEYKELVVRVSGFSAYFTSLRKVTQDEIISRTEVS